MKTVLLILASFLLCSLPAPAQDAENTYVVSGVVRDSRTHAPIESASVTLSGMRVGTVTNADGFFSLKLRRVQGQILEISRMGFTSAGMALDGRGINDTTIYLRENPVRLRTVTVNETDALEVLKKAVSLIGSNYSAGNTVSTCFYRETIRKRHSYIEVSEAVTEVFKTPYSRGYTSADRTRVVKGRALISTNPRDTLGVKLQGGPAGAVSLDLVKTGADVLDPATFVYYDYSMAPAEAIGDRPHYVVEFVPNADIPSVTLFRGRFHIDKQTLAISQVEASMDMSDKNKVTGCILARKPPGLRFTPEEVYIKLIYDTRRDTKACLYYMQTRMRFRCDWRRKLFSTAYTVVSEIVATDVADGVGAGFPQRSAFGSGQIFADRVSGFYDPEFWEGYNIIEPSESLEDAARRLRKRTE